jgi:hypothetical protein
VEAQVERDDQGFCSRGKHRVLEEMLQEGVLEGCWEMLLWILEGSRFRFRSLASGRSLGGCWSGDPESRTTGVRWA